MNDENVTRSSRAEERRVAEETKGRGKGWAYIKRSVCEQQDVCVKLGAPANAEIRGDDQTFAVWMGDGAPTEEPFFPPAIDLTARTWAFVTKASLDIRTPHGVTMPNYLKLALEFFDRDLSTPVKAGDTCIAVWLHDGPPDVEPVWP